MVVVASSPPLELSPSSSYGGLKKPSKSSSRSPQKMVSLFQFRAPPSLKQAALFYGVILALDFTSNG